MKTFFKKMVFTGYSVLYLLLLPWAVYIMINYLFNTGWLKVPLYFVPFILEIILWIYLVRIWFRRQKETRKIGSRIVFGLMIVTFVLYIVTVADYFTKVIMGFLS
jgi:hypothetical protein